MDEDSAPRTSPAILSVEFQLCWRSMTRYVAAYRGYYLASRIFKGCLGAADTSAAGQEPMGDILVFLTGQDDVDAAVQLINENAQNLGKHSSGLSRADQELVFSPAPKGKRKAVVSTNIAETSLTLEGVVYVVDSGFSKQRFYNPSSWGACFKDLGTQFDLVNLDHIWDFSESGITMAHLWLLFPEHLQDKGLEELEESDLGNVIGNTCLLLKALGIDNILGFDWLAPPAPEAMIRALEVLFSLGILDEDAKLTSPTGFQVAEIPLDPMISKMILSAHVLGCTEEIITIAAILSVQSIWVSSRGAQKEFDEVKLRFAVAEKKVIDIREQLRKLARRLGLVMKSCEGDTLVVRKAITAGFFANACRLEKSFLFPVLSDLQDLVWDLQELGIICALWAQFYCIQSIVWCIFN
ncbi:ATP-dependent RNA helicase [Asimina triloba]